MKFAFRKGSAFVSKKAEEYFNHKEPQDIKNIAVIRHAAIGDWVVTRPFLIELKKFFSNAKITLSVNRSAMYGIPEDLVDYIHIMDKDNPNNKSKKTSLIDRIKQAKKLSKQEILFDLTDSSMSLLLTIFSNADIKVGYPYRSIRRWFYDISTLRSDFVLETISMLHQINILGANTKHYPLEYQLTKKTTNLEKPYIIYFAGASMKNRFWGDDNFISLIEKMSLQYPQYKHVILKGIKEDEQFNEIYQPFKDIDNVVQQDALPIEDIYDYLGEASLVIVGDTGIRNMAIATHTPTIGIMFIQGISPLRYLPKIEEHQVVYNTDYTRPSTEDVFNATVKLLTSLYN
jgi:ADP-heptose:LPS heptosyltransferase